MRGPDYTARFEAPGGKPVLTAYPDPLTGGEPFTIGLGHTGADVKRDSVWPEDQCLHAFANDYAVAGAAALHVVGADVWARLNEARRAVLTDMAFNIGPARLRGFVKMLAAIRTGDWTEAAAQMLDSAYARQVKRRAQTNAKTLLTGEMP
jgi:lysozyme